jgi:uncharacterized protein YbbC (DUF1343 family)/CubicO group peptidase (beta-lactamase class C family)
MLSAMLAGVSGRLRSGARLPGLSALLVGMAIVSGSSIGGQSSSPSPQPAARIGDIDRVVEAAIAAGQTPGAVVLVGRGDRVLHFQAYGVRSLVPSREPMTLDTIFDLASLTKVVATTTAVMTLVEHGRVRLNDPVSAYVPGFERYGKGGVTIGHLMAHVSGLRPDLDLAEPWKGYDTAIELARAEVLTSAPGDRFVYSDINFLLLGEVVRVASGERLDQYTKKVLFAPLGMGDTGFLPAESLRARIAPTERCEEMDQWPCKRPDAAPLRGVVHDPTARRMGGVAGHAGLFGTAQDLSRFARVLLGGGVLDGVRVLAPAAVARMTSRATPPALKEVRGLGWDIDTSYSSLRGELFPIGSYGHTGFTGTSLWIDPGSGAYVIILASRLHPDGGGDMTPLRARVATIAAAALPDMPYAPRTTTPALTTAAIAAPQPTGPVLAGIDVLARDGFTALDGRKVGLLTNHTGVDRAGVSTIDVLHQGLGSRLVALFSPEHGVRGTRDDEHVESEQDAKTGLTVHSLYGENRRPTAEMLRGLDTIVVDLADVGARFYTYYLTMAWMMEEAAAHRLSVVVLDRPNPINGWQIEGPTPPASSGFLGYHPMPVRHGLTIGELARLFNGERNLGVDLRIVPVEGWVRDAWFDQTGLPWVNLSPNMRNLNQATLYPGIGAIEFSNISVGRGTDQPFEQIGAPWIDAPRLAETLNARKLPGIRFYPVTFTPAASKYEQQPCHGVFMVITDRMALQPVRVGLEIGAALARLFGAAYQIENTDRLLGSRESLERVLNGEDPGVVAASWAAAEARWRQTRAKYLLYK